MKSGLSIQLWCLSKKNLKLSVTCHLSKSIIISDDCWFVGNRLIPIIKFLWDRYIYHKTYHHKGCFFSLVKKLMSTKSNLSMYILGVKIIVAWQNGESCNASMNEWCLPRLGGHHVGESRAGTAWCCHDAGGGVSNRGAGGVSRDHLQTPSAARGWGWQAVNAHRSQQRLLQRPISSKAQAPLPPCPRPVPPLCITYEF